MKLRYRMAVTRKRLVIVSLGYFFLSSCASDMDNYSSEWAPIEIGKKGRCPDVTGIYSRSGESTQKSGTTYDLVAKLGYYSIGRESQAGGVPTHVEFNVMPNNELAISFWAEDEKVFTKLFRMKDGDFSCNKQFITFHESDSGAGTYGWAYARDKLRLTKSNDGFLVLKQESTTTGIIAIVPFRYREGSWIREGLINSCFHKY